MLSFPLSFLSMCALFSMITMVSQRKHILMALLSLEAMILNLMMLTLFVCCSYSIFSLFLTMILLTFGACEAALGLSCLVKMTRTFGNDQISSSNLNSC
uniref:NADH-ubiquinone oxidoreductase chain 4L n=1 Tax=Arctonoe vittata TaxID=862921 RepID=A0A8F2F7I1_9ANNE|nr:NADH dehydrogenase subunit 4L [Arctonoe vittata]